jgi:hypothetical protein
VLQSTLEQKIKISEFKMVTFLHENNLAFNLMTKAAEVTKVIKDDSVELIINSLKGNFWDL